MQQKIEIREMEEKSRNFHSIYVIGVSIIVVLKISQCAFGEQDIESLKTYVEHNADVLEKVSDHRNRVEKII